MANLWSVDRTFDPRSGKEALLAKLDKVATDLEEDLARTQWAGRTLTLKYKLDTYQSMHFSHHAHRYLTLY